jgi:hypothetical protein
MYVPAYVLVILGLIVLSFRMFRLPKWPPLLKIAAWVNVLTLIPILLMVCTFAGGANTTVQFNVGSPSAMRAWSVWVQLWPILMLDLMVCLGVIAVVTLMFLALNFSWHKLQCAKIQFAYNILTLVHCLFATNWIGSNFPSA